MNLDLFAEFSDFNEEIQPVQDGVVLLRGFAKGVGHSLLSGLTDVVGQAPFRHMVTPGGLQMSVAMTNCGQAGWISDISGYRYVSCDPLTGQAWPVIPEKFVELACNAAELAGYPNFLPDACLINSYLPGTKLSLHQDKNERDLGAPIVSVSLGLPAVFLFGGLRRNDRLQRHRLDHGDVLVWGGCARLNYHGVAKIAQGCHSLLGSKRINLTFRKAL